MRGCLLAAALAWPALAASAPSRTSLRVPAARASGQAAARRPAPLAALRGGVLAARALPPAAALPAARALPGRSALPERSPGAAASLRALSAAAAPRRSAAGPDAGALSAGYDGALAASREAASGGAVLAGAPVRGGAGAALLAASRGPDDEGAAASGGGIGRFIGDAGGLIMYGSVIHFLSLIASLNLEGTAETAVLAGLWLLFLKIGVQHLAAMRRTYASEDSYQLSHDIRRRVDPGTGRLINFRRHAYGEDRYDPYRPGRVGFLGRAVVTVLAAASAAFWLMAAF